MSFRPSSSLQECALPPACGRHATGVTSGVACRVLHTIEFDSNVNDFIVLQAKVTAAMAEKEREIAKASKEITAVKAELEKMKQSNKEKDVQIEKDLDTINDVENLQWLHLKTRCWSSMRSSRRKNRTLPT